MELVSEQVSPLIPAEQLSRWPAFLFLQSFLFSFIIQAFSPMLVNDMNSYTLTKLLSSSLYPALASRGIAVLENSLDKKGFRNDSSA